MDMAPSSIDAVNPSSKADKGKRAISETNPTPQAYSTSTKKASDDWTTMSNFINIHKRERKMELSAVVQLDDGSISIKKTKVSLTSKEISFYTGSLVEVAEEESRGAP